MNTEAEQKTSEINETQRERLDLIVKSISTYSPSSSESRFANLIMEELRSKGFKPTIDGSGNVICEYGSGNMTLLLCGHMDTVPGELEVKMVDGFVTGRGACDAKGALLSLLFAFEDLAVQNGPQGRLIFAAVTQEELASVGLMELLNNGVKADYAMFGEPGGVSRITVGYRGHITSHLEVVTPTVHASAPKLTINSIELLFDLYNSIKRRLGAEDSQSTDKISASITEISGGSSHNVIPGTSNATIDVRVPVGSSTDQARSAIIEAVETLQKSNTNARISVSFDEPTEPYRVKLNSPLVRAISRSILKIGEKATFVTKSGTGDMNTYANHFGIDAITYGPGDAKLSHTSDEKVEIKEIFACSEIIVNATNELFSMKNTMRSSS